MGKRATRLSSIQEDLLTALRFKPLYGLQIISITKEASNDKFTIAVGSLYPILKKMEENGLIETYWGQNAKGKSAGARRKYYKITNLGEKTLAQTQKYRAKLSAS